MGGKKRKLLTLPSHHLCSKVFTLNTPLMQSPWPTKITRSQNAISIIKNDRNLFVILSCDKRKKTKEKERKVCF